MIKYFRRIWNNMVTDYMDEHRIFVIDTETNDKYSLTDVIIDMRMRIDKLEYENIETTNCLYEMQNRLDMLSSCQYNMLENPCITDKDV